MNDPLVLAIDQGTSSTKALLVNSRGDVVARGQCPVAIATPKPGWVEQDAEAIWQSVLSAIADAVTPETTPRIAAIGLSTQRESFLAWDGASGVPLAPMLSWQDQRTLALCERLSDADRRQIRARSGLPLDPMFSAAKAQWLLDQVDPDRSAAKSGGICLGTVDSYLVSRCGGGHVIELGNASRTQLLAIDDAAFDSDLLAMFDVPSRALPRVMPSKADFARVSNIPGIMDGTPVTAVLADSHAALFAHGAFAPGKVKATQGTGSSVMGLYDSRVPAERIDSGVCRTIAWQVDDVAYAFEGNIRSAGSTLILFANLLGTDTQGLAALAAEVQDSGGINIVPAFGGLGSPYWDSDAVGLLGGIALGSSRQQVARAALDSIGHQIADVLDRVRASGLEVRELCVDGGPTKNDALMQFEADMTGVAVVRPRTAELSALGAAHLAGHAVGIWSRSDLVDLPRPGDMFHPSTDEVRRRRLRSEWRCMVERSRGMTAQPVLAEHPQAKQLS